MKVLCYILMDHTSGGYKSYTSPIWMIHPYVHIQYLRVFAGSYCIIPLLMDVVTNKRESSRLYFGFRHIAIDERC